LSAFSFFFIFTYFLSLKHLQLFTSVISDKTVSDRDRFDRLLQASLVIILSGTRATSSLPDSLAACERMVEEFSSVNADQLSSSGSGSLSSSGSFSVSSSFFYPTPTDILRCRLLHALHHLMNGKLGPCANTLLSVPQTCLDVKDNAVNDIATISDIVMYITLCALATMNRQEIKTNLIENQDFREWLSRDDCKTMRTLVDSFFNGDWSVAFATCLEVESFAKYDKFFGKQVPEIMQSIRDKLFLQYCKPYQRIKISVMEKNFNLPADMIETTFVRMIEKGYLKARIDGINHEVIRYVEDPRDKAFESAMKAGSEYEDWTNRDLFYANIVDGGYLNPQFLLINLIGENGLDEKDPRYRMLLAKHMQARGHSRQQRYPGSKY